MGKQRGVRPCAEADFQGLKVGDKVIIIREFTNKDVFKPPKRNPGVFGDQYQYLGKSVEVVNVEGKNVGWVTLRSKEPNISWDWPDFCIGLEYEIEVIPDEIDLIWNKQL